MDPTRPATDWRKLRDRADLSQRDLARLSGIQLAYIAQIEIGRMVPTAAEAHAILTVLHDAIETIDRKAIEA